MRKAHRDIVVASRILGQASNALEDAHKKLKEVDRILGSRGSSSYASKIARIVAYAGKETEKLIQRLQ